MKKKEPLLSKASLVTVSLVDLSIIVKAFLGSISLPSTMSFRTASSSRTQGSRVLKVCLCPIPLSDPPSPDAH